MERKLKLQRKQVGIAESRWQRAQASAMIQGLFGKRKEKGR